MDEELSILDAVDQLAHMAELDQKAFSFSSDVEKSRRVVKETFRVLHGYLRKLYEKDKEQFSKQEMSQGVQAIMALAGEAAQKVDKFTTLFKGVTESGSVTDTSEYQGLKKFYLAKISKRLEQTLKQEEAWQAEWGGEENILDIERRGLKDLETVKRDRDYELFYLYREDGRPFCNRNLVRHIQLVGNFDEILTDATGEHPFSRVDLAQDKQICFAAKEILRGMMPHLDPFYKEALQHKEMSLVAALNKALMALMLAANTRNLMQHATGKSCVDYFKDFHLYLREAYVSPQYQQLLLAAPGRFLQSLIRLAHELSSFFFMREAKHKEIIEVIHKFLLSSQKSTPSAHVEVVPTAFWNAFLDQDEKLRRYLQGCPSGPLLKLFEAFRDEEERQGFDPLSQGNFPVAQFSVSCNDLNVSFLHLPTPTLQEIVEQPEIVPEFKGFLRLMDKKKHLLINLQDRTLWQEHPRCVLLEKLPTEEPYSSSLSVVTLTKNTDFYLQTAPYNDLHHAQTFMEQLRQQILSGEECGFYFPEEIKKAELKAFIDPCMAMIHTYFFSNKEHLELHERLDFIEIFDHFLVLKLIDKIQPDSLSFTCKDALDTGAAATSGFYALVRMLVSADPWTKEEQDFLLWLTYAPALETRHRAIHPQRLHRMVSACAAAQHGVDKHRHELLGALSKLYDNISFRDVQIII